MKKIIKNNSFTLWLLGISLSTNSYGQTISNLEDFLSELGFTNVTDVNFDYFEKSIYFTHGPEESSLDAKVFFFEAESGTLSRVKLFDGTNNLLFDGTNNDDYFLSGQDAHTYFEDWAIVYRSIFDSASTVASVSVQASTAQSVPSQIFGSYSSGVTPPAGSRGKPGMQSNKANQANATAMTGILSGFDYELSYTLGTFKSGIGDIEFEKFSLPVNFTFQNENGFRMDVNVPFQYTETGNVSDFLSGLNFAFPGLSVISRTTPLGPGRSPLSQECRVV